VFVVDTNVLVYAANRKSPYHRSCLQLLEAWRQQAGAWHLTWGICYEFLRVATHPRTLQSPWTVTEAWAFLEAILAAPSLSMLVPTERHAGVLGELTSRLPHLCGNILHDVHTAALMREHGIRTIYTRDSDFHRFPFLEPIDPVTST